MGALGSQPKISVTATKILYKVAGFFILFLFLFLSGIYESNDPVSAHTCSESAGVRCLIVSDTSPTVPLHSHRCSQGHDDSSQDKIGIDEKREN